MNQSSSVEVKRYEFNSNLVKEFQNLHYVKDLWPIVYILSDGKIKEAYVGETTDTYSRMGSHLKSNKKNKLTSVHLITSEKFNKSATLDIESNLIKYISGDGQYKLINANIGLANHNYYQKKEIYWDIFKTIWNQLRAEGLSTHSIDHINNSDLFKYSPYKTLTNEQKGGLLMIIKSLLGNDFSNLIIEGGAGTGKTVLATFLFKLLNTNNDDFNFKEFGDEESEFSRLIAELKNKYPKPRMAFVIPMSSFRETMKKVFRNIKGLNANMVIGPAEIVKNKYDIVVVDESHRLRRRVNLGTYFGAFDKVCKILNIDKNMCSELDWILKQSDKSILFYDHNQSIKPSDTKREDFNLLKGKSGTKSESLKSQFRVRGGNDYVEYIDKLLKCSFEPGNTAFDSKQYEFILFDSISDMVKEIKQRDIETGLSRMIAGFSWPWISKNDKGRYDINIDGEKLQWNRVTSDWINSPNASNEVGCIHTTQAYDLNYAGIIFGNEIVYDKVKKEIGIIKQNYFDKNGQAGISEIKDLKEFIINIYRTIMLRGIKGTYVYVCNKELREYFAEHIVKFRKEQSNLILAKSNVEPYINSIPLYDLRAAAGNFSELQNVSDCEWVSIPSRYKPSPDLFACTIFGESMNKIIPSGSICLFRKDNGGSRNGKIVLVEHSNIQEPDFGSGYTVKEYSSKKADEMDQWSHLEIILKPLSFDQEHKEIQIYEDETSRVRVVGIFECVIG